MKQLREIPIEDVREYFAYDPDSGKITNKKARRGVVVGEEAGADRGHGYRKVFFRGKYYYSHRLAWAIHYGAQPPDIIDHIDGDGHNNAIGNLRGAEHRQNIQNQKRRSDNTSGRKGVSWNAHVGKWVANCGNVYLGCFDDKSLASDAYEAAAVKQFGDYARLA
jgi:hypothetical protein